MIDEKFELIREMAWRALGAIRPVNSNTKADKHFLFNSKQTDAGRQLPPYYLVYFLLVDLLGFKNLGRFEKVDWSVPIDFNGQAYLIEHRKFGLCLLAHDPYIEQVAAEEIVIRIKKAVKVAVPYFDWLASQAIERSEVNVVNNSIYLHGRYEFLRALYSSKLNHIARRNKKVTKNNDDMDFHSWISLASCTHGLQQEANWIAISVIEAFFSWTEHVLIHIAILIGNVTSAKSVADLAIADWAKKFQSVFKLGDKSEKALFDRILSLRQELRNFIAHGAFGKQGEAFSFHSTAGAVPVLLPHKRRSKKFIFGDYLQFDAEAALKTIDEFTCILWAGEREPARVYVHESGLPTILTFAADGTYISAMTSVDSMENLVEYLSNLSDQASNMDW